MKNCVVCIIITPTLRCDGLVAVSKNGGVPIVVPQLPSGIPVGVVCIAVYRQIVVYIVLRGSSRGSSSCQ